MGVGVSARIRVRVMDGGMGAGMIRFASRLPIDSSSIDDESSRLRSRSG